MRIVSLLPSATETAFAIGAGEDVVAVTFECDYPQQARTRTIVSTSALPEGLSPKQIDEAVRRLVHSGADLYHLDQGALRGLDADVVLTQNLCAVCAVDLDVVADALDFLGCRARVVTTDPHTLSQVWQSVLDIGEATGRQHNAAALVERLRRRTGAVVEAVRGLPRPRVALLEWPDPAFAPGHWVPEMIESAGGTSVLGQSGTKSVRVGWDQVRAARPQVVVSAPCGYALASSVELADRLVESGNLDPGLPLWAVDANASFARPGPRLVDGVEALAALLHPELGVRPDPTVAQRVR